MNNTDRYPDRGTYCARIVFYSREGWNLQDQAFTNHTDAEEMFDALRGPGHTDLPPNWYAARLELFDGLLHVNFRIQDTIYRDEQRTPPPSLLSLVRTNIKQRRAKDAAAYDCDCHLQAGYDTGHAEQYLDERDRLWRIYYDACEAESATEHALFALLKEDRIDYGRIQRIVFDFS